MDSQAELVHSVTYFPQWIDNSNYDNDNLMNNTFSGNDHSQSKQFKIKLKANVRWLVPVDGAAQGTAALCRAGSQDP